MRCKILNSKEELWSYLEQHELDLRFSIDARKQLDFQSGLTTRDKDGVQYIFEKISVPDERDSYRVVKRYISKDSLTL